MKKITIIGSGFAGLTAVRTLRKQDKTLEITLISPKAELVYMPSLISSISLSLSRIFSTLLNPSQGVMAFSIPGNFLIKDHI
jgi:NADH dehydrogenase FAD-containing subunit